MLKLEVIGNLGADCEVKDSNGSKFVTFRVAHTEKFRQQDGKEITSTSWVDVTYNKTDSAVLPFLKQGVKVYVRGNAHLRAYPSKKDKCWKAGVTIAATEIELCGGSSDDVPRQLTDAETGAIYDVTKWYWANAETKGMKKNDMKLLLDNKGREYGMNSQGFVAPVPENVEQENEQVQNSEAQPK